MLNFTHLFSRSRSQTLKNLTSVNHVSGKSVRYSRSIHSSVFHRHGTGIQNLKGVENCHVLRITRGKRTAAKSRTKSAIKSRMKQKQQLSSSSSSTHFGLHPVDYNSVVPPIYATPPPPPTRPGLKQWLFPGTIVLTLAFSLHFYFNNKNDAFEYWDAMQSGNLPSEFLDDDDDDDDDEEEDYDNESQDKLSKS